MMKEIKELVRISNEIGKLKDLVQASGGNISIKTVDGKMIIKASGFTFSEMTEKSGFSIVDYKKLIRFFINRSDSQIAEENEGAYNETLINSIVDSKLPRPSMEAGMHVFLNRVVVHTHPVMTNILNCMENGEKIIRELFSYIHPEIMLVDYKNPGYHLAREIKKKISSYESKNGIKPEVIFLKNHGLIMSKDDSSNCVSVTLGLNKKVYMYLKDNFDIESFSIPELKLKNNIYFSDDVLIKRFIQHLKENESTLSKFLIPDDAIYCPAEISKGNFNEFNKNKITVTQNGAFFPWDKKKSTKIFEMFVSKAYITLMIDKIGKISYLQDKDVNYLQNMESEKYRQTL